MNKTSKTMKYIKILIFIFTLLVSVAICAEKATINDLLQDSLKTGEFIVEGYIIDVFECPPCPEGANCAKCLDPNFTISEKREPLSYDTSAVKTQMNIQGDIYKFKKWKKYTFVINAKSRVSGSYYIRWFELIKIKK